ncbi:IL17F protein, partial [Crypturellus undulatus]|nr:IL17F protein [Crypturellus undulatus]
LRSLLLVLVLALMVSSSPPRRAIHPRLSKDGGFKKLGEDCPTQKDLKFPATVKVDVHFSNSDPVSRIIHDVRNRSLAPWDYRLDEDPNRFPQVIADATCRHSSCVGPQGQEDHGLNSVPIRQEILVLRREPQGCLPTYRLEKKVITVGCTCATPLVQHQS